MRFLRESFKGKILIHIVACFYAAKQEQRIPDLHLI